MAKLDWKKHNDKEKSKDSIYEKDRQKYLKSNPWLREKLNKIKYIEQKNDKERKMEEAKKWIEEVKNRAGIETQKTK